MVIKDFTNNDIEKAKLLVMENYNEERAQNPALPALKNLPGLEEYARNGLGVAVYEADALLGFLCAEISERFGALRAFSPVHAHGAVEKNRGGLYSRMYAAAAEKWVKQKALTHEITLFSHDSAGIESYFYNVFGACVIYAVMDLNDKEMIDTEIEGVELRELDKERYSQIMQLQNGLLSHLRHSPIFLPYLKDTPETFSRIKDKRYFAAFKDNEMIAYIRLQNGAGNFVAKQQDTINISGAFMKPEYRGSGIYSKLLAFLADAVKREGYNRLSVDFETYNPNAMKFWTKNFTPYTTRLTRKIEPKILTTPDF